LTVKTPKVAEEVQMRNLYLAATAVIIAGCATPAPTVQFGGDAETTFDGLVRVNNSAFQRAWVDPTIDLSQYSKILPGAAEFEFRAVRGGGTSMRRSSATEFPISEADQQRLKDLADEIFNEELRNSTRFTMTDSPGPDVLVVRGAMLDIVSNVPPTTAGRSDIFLSRVGEATLVLEIVDSVSGETLARAAERGAAQPAGNRGVRSSGPANTAEVRRLFRRWAVRLGAGQFPVHQCGCSIRRSDRRFSAAEF
jgi:hypothetical protein